MPSESPPPTPAEWLRHAKSDLALAGVRPPPGVLLETLCFHAHQAAEKALKGVLVANSIPPPATHNIRPLLALIPEDYPPEVGEAAVLTQYGVPGIYRGDPETVREPSYRKALALAEVVMVWSTKVGCPIDRLKLSPRPLESGRLLWPQKVRLLFVEEDGARASTF